MRMMLRRAVLLLLCLAIVLPFATAEEGKKKATWLEKTKFKGDLGNRVALIRLRILKTISPTTHR